MKQREQARGAGPERAGTGQAVALCRNTSDGPLRVLMSVAAVFAAGGTFLAGMLLDSSVHLSHHISFAERAVWASLLMLTFSCLFAGSWMYGRRLATGIDLSADGRRLSVRSPTLLGEAVREVHLSQIGDSSVHAGDTAGQESTSPPYIWVRVHNDRSFVVPLSGQIPNRQRLLKALQVDARDLRPN